MTEKLIKCSAPKKRRCKDIEWNVTHFVRGERMTKDELKSRYASELKDVAVRAMNIYAEKFNVEVKLSA